VFGDDVSIASKPVRTHFVVHRAASLTIGSRVRFEHGCGIACHSRVEVGDDTHVGAFTLMLDSDYHVAGDPTKQPEPSPIRVGRGVRIGSHVTILRGSVIEDGAIIESGSVVSGAVEEGMRVSGVPARPLLASTAKGSAQGAMTVESRIAGVAMACFRLNALPTMEDGPGQIARWDSLGGLLLVLALEEEFGVLVGPDQAHTLRRLGDFVPVLTR